MHAQTIANGERACIFVVFLILLTYSGKFFAARVPSVAVVVVHPDAVPQAVSLV